MKIVTPSAKLLWITPNAEQMIELAGRTCYKSEQNITEESSAKFIKMLKKNKHLAMLEHASASILFTCDRGVTHELGRQRLAAYAQESTRFCNYSKDKFNNEISVIEPPNLSRDEREIWREACLFAESSYIGMLNKGAAPQIARSVLPTCLKTEIVTTCNFREWIHIFNLRFVGITGPPHPQIREIMTQAYNILCGECPSVFCDLEN